MLKLMLPYIIIIIIYIYFYDFPYDWIGLPPFLRWDIFNSIHSLVAFGKKKKKNFILWLYKI